VRPALVVCFAVIAVIVFRSCERENLWKWRVHRRVKAEELRGWYSQVHSNPPVNLSHIPWETLNHAPAYLTNIEPVKIVMPMPNYVWLGYGKVRHQWGLAIGETNSPPPNDLKKSFVEAWAPGIYYWRE